MSTTTPIEMRSHGYLHCSGGQEVLLDPVLSCEVVGFEFDGARLGFRGRSWGVGARVFG